LARTARTPGSTRPHPQSQLPRQARGRVGLCFSSGAQPPEGRPRLAGTAGLQGREGRDRAGRRVGSYGSAGTTGRPGPAGTARAGGAQGGEGGAWPARGVSSHSGRLNFNNVDYRVGRVLSFFSSRRNWDSPTPPPRRRVRPPTFWFRWGGHTRLRERGWGSPSSDWGTYEVC
jgi:hypothetical protein